MEKQLLSQEVINQLVDLSRDHNIFPNFFYQEMGTGNKNPFSIALKATIKTLTLILGELTEAELNEIFSQMSDHFRWRYKNPNEYDRSALVNLLALEYIEEACAKVYTILDKIVENSIENSKVLARFPELIDKIDKYGLLMISEDMELLSGGIKYKDHILHYHQFLRRGYFSNPNFDFFYRYIKYYKLSHKINTFGVAIDHSRIMESKYYQEIMELDTWYGPGYDKLKLDDPNYAGTTVVLRNHNSIMNLENRIQRTEFYWKQKKSTKSVEIEEIRPDDSAVQEYILNRYFHSERDIINGVFQHMDGAVKVYKSAQYPARFNSHVPREPKCFRKIKLFRIDGRISEKDWSELLGLFYKGNEMIIEYFDPNKFKTLFIDRN
jgi:hypothetical protein